MSQISQAVELARARGILPTSLGTAEIRDLSRDLLDRSFWSARTSHEIYLTKLKALVERYVLGEGYNNDLAQLRIEARKLLVSAGYTPEHGFPGDAELGIPPARPGSLQDLSSERRLNLIYETQAALMRGKGQKLRGLDRMEQFPAWELIRLETRRAPRDWVTRWETAGAPLVHVDGLTRLIAPKDAEVWSVLGDSALFKDALNVDHPPFAFGSGMGWEEVDFRDWEAISGEWHDAPEPEPESEPQTVRAPDPATTPPPSDLFIGGQATLDRLLGQLAARRAAAGL